MDRKKKGAKEKNETAAGARGRGLRYNAGRGKVKVRTPRVNDGVA